jgi:hypothetical protein
LIVRLTLLVSVFLAQAASPNTNPAAIPPDASQIMQLANQARAEAGAAPLRWDPALAEAARQHCSRMATEESSEHQYTGEPDISQRAGHAGAHFSVIAESVAVGSTPTDIHRKWMQSPDDRSNMLNPQVDRVGIAVVAHNGILYAVAEYAHAVPALTQAQIESAVSALLRKSGLQIMRDNTAARAACVTDKRLFRSDSGPQPGFELRWQDSDLTHLPQGLMERIKTPQFSQAAVGSCPPQDVNGAFTVYRVAVILYY